MTVTIGEAYMLHRLAPRPFSARVLHCWTFATVGVSIATAIAFAWWTAIDVRPLQVSDASIRLISSDRIQQTTTDTAVPSVEIPTATSSEATEPVPQAPTSGENGIVLQPPAESAAPFVPLAARKVGAMSPRARAEMPRVRKRNAERSPAPGLSLAPPEKSFTGAGGGFDAVH